MENPGFELNGSAPEKKYFKEDLREIKMGSSGCRITKKAGFVLTVFVLAAIVGSGLIAHYVTKNQMLNEVAPKTTAAPAQKPTQPTPEPPEPPRDVRLTRDVLPTHYNVEWKPDLYSSDMDDFSLSGKVEIFMTCMNATSTLILQIKKLAIDSSTLKFEDSKTGNAVPYSKWEEDKSRQFFKLYPKSPLVEGGMYKLSMSFRGPLTNDLSGLYISEYTRGNDTVYLATSQMQATDARKTFPCFDEPSMKATFNITCLVKPPYHAISNMPVETKTPMADGWVAYKFQTTEKMSTYLLALIVSDFVNMTAMTKRNTEMRVWARPEAIKQASYALEATVNITEYFEDYFNISFPLPKQDMAAVPDFAAGAMENWGLIIYREAGMLYEPGVSSDGDKELVGIYIAHELTHQWFGNLVTPKWWNDLWLNEGFASYLEYVGLDKIEPGFKMMDLFVDYSLGNSLNVDALATSHPLLVPVATPDEINEIFDDISYIKGASVIRMMVDFIGEQTFRNGIIRYLKKYSYDVANNNDLWTVMQQQAEEENLSINVKDVMSTWTLQMGFPVVAIKRNPSNQNEIILTQKHFLLDPEAEVQDEDFPSPYKYKWEIPFTYITKTNQEKKVKWMSRTQAEVKVTIPESEGWILGNIGAMNYYRVDYGSELWDDLIQQLNTSHEVISIANRAQLIEDAFNLARAGMMNFSQALSATIYMDREREYLPWKLAFANLGYLKGLMAKSPYFYLLEDYILKKLKPVYLALGGWNETIGQELTHQEKYLRVIVRNKACDVGLKDCTKEVIRQFDEWMKTGNNTIKESYKGLVYCNAISFGGVKEWDFAYDQYKKSNVAAEQQRLLDALTCTKIGWLQSRLLDWCLDKDKIRLQDGAYQFAGVATQNPELAWMFFNRYWTKINKIFGGSFGGLGTMVSSMVSSFSTPYELNQVEQFLKQNPKIGSAKRTFQQGLERIKGNIKWVSKHEAGIVEWLKEQTK